MKHWSIERNVDELKRIRNDLAGEEVRSDRKNERECEVTLKTRHKLFHWKLHKVRRDWQ